MSYFLGIAGGFLAGVAVMGVLAEKRLRRMQQDAQDFIAQDQKRRYGA